MHGTRHRGERSNHRDVLASLGGTLENDEREYPEVSTSLRHSRNRTPCAQKGSIRSVLKDQQIESCHHRVSQAAQPKIERAKNSGHFPTMPSTPYSQQPATTSISCSSGWSSCCSQSRWRRKRLSALKEPENEKLHGRLPKLNSFLLHSQNLIARFFDLGNIFGDPLITFTQ